MRSTRSEHNVVNTSGELIPAFAAMELALGFDTDGRRKVRKSTTDDSLDILFNGVMPIQIGEAGVGYEPWGSVTAGYDVADPTPPAPGDIRGTRAGQWLLQAGRKGFRVSGDPFNGGVTVEPSIQSLLSGTSGSGGSGSGSISGSGSGSGSGGSGSGSGGSGSGGSGSGSGASGGSGSTGSGASGGSIASGGSGISGGSGGSTGSGSGGSGSGGSIGSGTCLSTITVVTDVACIAGSIVVTKKTYKPCTLSGGGFGFQEV
jgi:hypothetical protein